MRGANSGDKAGVYGAFTVLSDQVKNLDWKARKATPKGKATAEELDEVHAKISALLGL